VLRGAILAAIARLGRFRRPWRSVPVTYEIDAGRGLIRTRCVGATTLPDVMDHFRILRSDPALPEMMSVLLDLTELTSPPDSAQIREVAAETGRMREVVRWGALAVVAPTDVLFGMSRMLEVMAETHFESTRVFRELAPAEAWLRSRARAS
jgi:hypothetical protein